MLKEAVVAHLRYCADIYLKGRRKTTVSEDSRCSIRDLNHTFTEYRAWPTMHNGTYTCSGQHTLLTIIQTRTEVPEIYKFKCEISGGNYRLLRINTIIYSGFFHVIVTQMLISICVLMLERRCLTLPVLHLTHFGNVPKLSICCVFPRLNKELYRVESFLKSILSS